MMWWIIGCVLWMSGAIACLGRANASQYQEDEEELDQFNEDNLPRSFWERLDDDNQGMPLWKRVAARALLLFVVAIISWGLFLAMMKEKRKRNEIYLFKWSWKKLREDVKKHPGELSNDVAARLSKKAEVLMAPSPTGKKSNPDADYDNDGFQGDTIEW